MSEEVQQEKPQKPVLSLRYPLERVQRIQKEFGLSRSRAMSKALDDAFEMYFGSAAS